MRLAGRRHNLRSATRERFSGFHPTIARIVPTGGAGRTVPVRYQFDPLQTRRGPARSTPPLPHRGRASSSPTPARGHLLGGARRADPSELVVGRVAHPGTNRYGPPSEVVQDLSRDRRLRYRVEHPQTSAAAAAGQDVTAMGPANPRRPRHTRRRCQEEPAHQPVEMAHGDALVRELDLPDREPRLHGFGASRRLARRGWGHGVVRSR